jgi:hypothetical protein
MKKIITALLIALAAMMASRGQTLDKLTLGNKQSILNGRAFLYFPAEAKNEKRGVGIMSADPNENEETRIVFDTSDMRLVFFAQEPFAFADKDLFTTISKLDEKEGYKTKILTDKDGLLSVLSTPTTFDSTATGIPVNTLSVVTPDNTLFRIDAYISPAGFKLIDQYQKLTENVFKTLTSGTRTVNRASRQEKLSIFGTDKSLTFNLPADYCITVDRQYDFQVFKLHKFQYYTDADWIQLIIYVGDFPSLVYKDYDLSESDGKKIKGMFLDKQINWLFFDISKKGLYDKEQVIACDHIAKGLKVHISMMSNQQKSLDGLTKIVEAIQVTK